MTKIIQNNILLSPIEKVEIREYDITLYNREKYIIFEDKIQLSHFFNFLPSVNKNLFTIVNEEINNAIENFYPERVIEEKASLLYTQIEKSVTEVFARVQQANKKLLIVVGEEHFSWDSFLFELLMLDICKKNGITDFCAEASKDTLSRLLSTDHNQFWAGYQDQLHYPMLLKTALFNGMSLHPVDPLNHDYISHTTTFLSRADKINESLSRLDKNAIFCVGCAHLPDIISDRKLYAKYEIIAFNTDLLPNNSTPDSLPLPSDRGYLEKLALKQQKLIDLHKNAKEKNEPDYDVSNFISKFLEYEEEASSQNMRALYSNQDIINLSIEQDRYDPVTPSCTQAVNIAMNIISKHHTDSPTLDALTKIKSLEEKLQNIFLQSPTYKKELQELYQLLTDPSYQSGYSDDESEYPDTEQLPPEEWDYFSQFSLDNSPTYSNILPDTPLLHDRELDHCPQTNNHLSDIVQQSLTSPDADLIGNWDTHPDC